MIEEMIMRLVEQLYSGVSSVSYKGIYFPVREIEYASPIDFRSSVHISIDIPGYFGLEANYVSESMPSVPTKTTPIPNISMPAVKR